MSSLRVIPVAILLSLALHAQSGNISGTVTDSSGNAALAGTKVSVEGQNLNGTADDAGIISFLACRLEPRK